MDKIKINGKYMVPCEKCGGYKREEEWAKCPHCKAREEERRQNE